MTKEIKSEDAKKLAELSKKLKDADREVKQKSEYLKHDIRMGQDTTINKNSLKYAVQKRDRIEKELKQYT